MLCSEVAKALSARLLGEDAEIGGLCQLSLAPKGALSVVLWPKDIPWAKRTKASAVLINENDAANQADLLSSSLLVVPHVEEVWDRLSELAKGFSEATLDSTFIHPTAQIHETAVVESGVRIGAYCEVGPLCVIHKGVVLGERVKVKAGSVLGSNAFAPSSLLGQTQLLRGLGSVNIGDGVEIGAHCTIDRGLIGITQIGPHTKIDNMVHVGHDVVIGSDVIIAAQTGIAGCVVIEYGVTIGGQAGIAPHVWVQNHSRISGKSGVHKDIKPYEVWSGNPAVLHSHYLRSHVYWKRKWAKIYEGNAKSTDFS